ncbi:MAG: hypothetical protein GTO40_03300, partial [Deltaproteobacteria bacterium]|nr:hypothetical protein [Deltaproteobacteria bacterium]
TSQIAGTQSQADLEAIKKELEAIKNNQQILRREIETLKRSMGRRGRSAGGFQARIVDVGNDPYKGDLNARLTLID